MSEFESDWHRALAGRLPSATGSDDAAEGAALRETVLKRIEADEKAPLSDLDPGFQRGLLEALRAEQQLPAAQGPWERIRRALHKFASGIIPVPAPAFALVLAGAIAAVIANQLPHGDLNGEGDTHGRGSVKELPILAAQPLLAAQRLQAEFNSIGVASRLVRSDAGNVVLEVRVNAEQREAAIRAIAGLAPQMLPDNGIFVLRFDQP